MDGLLVQSQQIVVQLRLKMAISLENKALQKFKLLKFGHSEKGTKFEKIFLNWY
jgi:hypothetical protein